jgi:hypothetical protein
MLKVFHLFKKRNDLLSIIKENYNTRFASIKDRYLDVDPDPGSSKYLDMDRWIPKFIHLANQLNLVKGKPCHILDLGTGPAYFPLVCKYYKHEVRALDLPNNPMYNELIKLFKIKRMAHRINAFEPIPAFDIKFDLITAFAICFNNHATDKVWGAKEWEFFISEIKANHANPTARLFLEFNMEPNGIYYTDELLKFFNDQQAVIYNNTVLLSLS